MTPRVFKFIALALSMVVLLAACTVAPPAAAPTMDDSDSEMMAGGAWDNVDPAGEEVSFWYQHSGARAEVLEEIISEFNETNEWGITVVGAAQGGYGDIFNKMLAVIGTADVPNLLVAYQNQAASYQLGEGLVDMRELVDSKVWGLSDEDKADFFPGFYAADVFPSFDNARLGFPPNRSMEVLYFNNDWLTELGYDGPPTTPAEFKEMACAANGQPFSGAATDTQSLGFQLSLDASTIASLSFAFGGDIFDYENVAYKYDGQATIDAMTLMQELFAEGCAVIPAERYGDQTDFGNGTTLFNVSSSSGLPYYASAVDAGAAFDWGVGPLPRTTEDPVVNVYGASVSIGQSTPEKELATWLFIKYYTSPAVQAKWAQASNYFPVRQSVADGLADYFASNPNYQTAFDLLPYGVSEPPVPGYDFVRVRVSEVMAAIVDGADVATSLAELTEEANEILADQ